MSRFKVSLLVLTLSLVVATPAAAQRSSSVIGISAGATSTDLQGGIINTQSQWGFIGGIFGAFRTSRNSMISLEANYVQKGGRNFADLAYIDVPFLIGAIIPTENDALNFNFYTGIGIGFKVSCTDTGSGVVDLCDRAKGTEWTWPFGLAFAVRTGGGKYLGLDGRYSLGISDAFDGSAMRNRGWQFKALFGVPVG